MPIDTVHPDYGATAPFWQVCRDLAGGEATVKSRRTTYLPTLEGQTGEGDQAYGAYLSRAMFYPAFERTVIGLSGMVLRRPTQVRVPSPLAAALDDLTLEADGGLQGVLVRVLSETFTVGRLGCLVDWDADGKRPYWTLYETEQIINWQETRVRGGWTPTLVVLAEKVPLPGRDLYSSETVPQWRELFLEHGLFHVRLWQAATDTGDAKPGLVVVKEWVPTRRGQPLEAIPFVTLSPRGQGLTPRKPPLLDLGLVNLSHYRSSADLEHGRHFVALPTPWVTGWVGEGATLRVGAGTAWLIPSEAAKVGMLEFTGAGLGALEKALEQKEKLMATIGARLLEQQPRAAETAEAVRLRQGGDHASLQTVVASVSSGLTLALQWAGWWVGIDQALGSQSIEVRLNADFAEARLSAQELDALTKLWQAGGISYETFYFNLQAGEIARPGIEVEEEQDAIDAEDALKATEADPADALVGVPPPTDEEDEVVPGPLDEDAEGQPRRKKPLVS